MLEYEAAVNTKNNKGISPLISACISGVIENVELLFSAGALINEVAKDGYTALMYVAYYGHAEIAEFLLSHGADSDAKSKKRETALSITEKEKI